MKGNQEWFQTTELIGIAGLPKTTQGVNLKARKDKWERRKAKGVKGRAFEYHIKSLPLETQQALRAHKPQSEVATQQEMTTIPYYEVYASAGNGLIPIEDELSPYSIDIHPQLLIDQGVPTNDLFTMPIKGDSMEPTLFDGDIAVVKRELEHPRVLEGVYVIRIDNQIFIKRIQYNRFEGYMQVNSDNDFYRCFTITNDDLNDVSILGEVVMLLGRARKRISETRENTIIKEFAELQTRAHNNHQESEKLN